MFAALVGRIPWRWRFGCRTGDQWDVAVGADVEPWPVFRAAARAMSAHGVEVVGLAGKVRGMPHPATWCRSGRLGARSRDG